MKNIKCYAYPGRFQKLGETPRKKHCTNVVPQEFHNARYDPHKKNVNTPEMASERMRILIRKFEPSSDAISSRCLATPASSEVPQTAARAIFE